MGPGVPLADQDGLAAVAGFQHRVAVHAQDLPHQGAHRLLVLDQQHGLLAVQGSFCPGARRRGPRHLLLGHARQEHLEGGALALLAVHHDGAAALLDDAVDGREAEPGPAVFLGGEEGLEEVGLDLLVHAHAGIGHRQHHVGSRHQEQLGAGLGAVELHVGGLQGQLPAAGHGVPGVEREVQDHLLELARIAMTSPRWGSRTVTSSMSSRMRRRSILSMSETGVEIERLGGQHLLAAEGQQLAGEGGRALGGVADLLQVLALQGRAPRPRESSRSA